MGPMVRAGRNVNPPTNNIIITRIKAKRASFVVSVPTDDGVIFLFASLPASASTSIIGTNLPKNMLMES